MTYPTKLSGFREFLLNEFILVPPVQIALFTKAVEDQLNLDVTSADQIHGNSLQVIELRTKYVKLFNDGHWCNNITLNCYGEDKVTVRLMPTLGEDDKPINSLIYYDIDDPIDLTMDLADGWHSLIKALKKIPLVPTEQFILKTMPHMRDEVYNAVSAGAAKYTSTIKLLKYLPDQFFTESTDMFLLSKFYEPLIDDETEAEDVSAAKVKAIAHGFIKYRAPNEMQPIWSSGHINMFYHGIEKYGQPFIQAFQEAYHKYPQLLDGLKPDDKAKVQLILHVHGDHDLPEED